MIKIINKKTRKMGKIITFEKIEETVANEDAVVLRKKLVDYAMAEINKLKAPGYVFIEAVSNAYIELSYLIIRSANEGGTEKETIEDVVKITEYMAETLKKYHDEEMPDK